MSKSVFPLYEAVFQALGEASMCWDPRPTSQVFDAAAVEAVGKRLLAVIDEKVGHVVKERDELLKAAQEARIELGAFVGAGAGPRTRRAFDTLLEVIARCTSPAHGPHSSGGALATQYNWESTGPDGCDSHCIPHPCGPCAEEAKAIMSGKDPYREATE